MNAKTRAQLRLQVRHNLREVASYNEAKTGTASVAAAGRAVTGSGTLFLTEFALGAEIKLEGEIREVTSITSDTALGVGTAFVSAHTAVTPYQVNERTWTEAEIDDALDEAVIQLGNLLWRDYPEALLGSTTSTLTAGTDTVTIPTTLRDFSELQVKPSSSGRYVPLTRLALTDKDRGGPWPWWTDAGQTKPTGIPARYAVVSASQIELDTLPQETIASGLRWYGSLKAQLDSEDSDTLENVPEPESFNRVLECWASAELILRDELLPKDRAAAYAGMGADKYRLATDQWAVGRARGPKRVRLTSRY